MNGSVQEHRFNVAGCSSGKRLKHPQRNMLNSFLHIVTSYPTGATLELLLTDAELARFGLGCHFALDCLGDLWDEL